jgi:hypothetical protein
MARHVLGPREFASKAQAQAEFRRILNDHPDNTPLRGDDAELVALLIHEGRHPETVQKIGPGIAEVLVRRSDYGTRGFWLLRVDGSLVDFSYLTALDGAPSPERTARAALRFEIADQTIAFRDSQVRIACGGLLACALCAQPVTPDAVHVDHAEPTFDDMATQFAAAVGGWQRLTVECVGATGRRLADRGLAQVWHRYHAHTARLRLTHARCNLTRGRSRQ